MKRKHLAPATNSIPVWSDVPEYEDWLLALGRQDDDESYGAYLEAFEDDIKGLSSGSSSVHFGIMMDSFQTALRMTNDD